MQDKAGRSGQLSRQCEHVNVNKANKYCCMLPFRYNLTPWASILRLPNFDTDTDFAKIGVARLFHTIRSFSLFAHPISCH